MTESRRGDGHEPTAPATDGGPGVSDGPAGSGLLTRDSAAPEPRGPEPPGPRLDEPEPPGPEPDGPRLDGPGPDGSGPLAAGSLARTPSPWRTAFIALAIAGLLAGAAWALLGSGLFVVRSVAVGGAHLVPAAEVRSAAGIPSGVPMIRVDTGAAARRVEEIPQVQSAQVAKAWPDRIVITVRERTPAVAVPVPAAVSASGGYYLVDASGVAVRWSRTRPGDLPLYQARTPLGGPGALRGSPDVAAAVAVLHEVPAPIARSVVAVAAPSPQAVTLRLANRVTIVWGSAGRASAKTRELAILMRTHARYYDVSAPGSAVTR